MMFSRLLNRKEVFFRRGMGREIILPDVRSFEKKDYRMLNVLNIYRDYNGGVQKILFVNIEHNVPKVKGEYYNNRSRTMVPVLDGDILLLSKYDTGSREYKLVQVDYSYNEGLRELFTDQDKTNIAKYLLYNNLVYIKPKEDKKSQLEPLYVKFINDSVVQEQAINQSNRKYSLEQLQKLLKKNIAYNQKKYTMEELLNMNYLDNENYELKDILLIARRSLHYANEIFKDAGKERLTLDEIKNHAAVCEYNYRFNL